MRTAPNVAMAKAIPPIFATGSRWACRSRGTSINWSRQADADKVGINAIQMIKDPMKLKNKVEPTARPLSPEHTGLITVSRGRPASAIADPPPPRFLPHGRTMSDE